LTAAEVARGGVRLAEPGLGEDGSVWWLERRPADGGRAALVRDGEDVTPKGFNVRTRVHEYGGGAWVLHGDAACVSSFEDGRLYRAGPEPEPITPEGAFRYADGRVSPDGNRLVCVRETHGDEVVNEVVSIPLGGGEVEVLASGRDFYSFPRLSPDGERLAYLCWDHPNMPWDGTELWLEGELVVGGPEESIWQPDWSPDGRLHWVSDRTGFWQLYREGRQLTDVEAELGYPQWLLGGSTYAFLGDGTIAVVRCLRAEDRLCLVGEGGELAEVDLPYTAYGFPSLRSRGDQLAFVAGSPAKEPELVVWSRAEGARVVKSATDEPLDPAWASVPEEIEFAGSGGLPTFAWHYPPTNPDFEGPEGELPPLVVNSHGGPTGHSPPALMAEDVLFWTSRGFAVVDVNYGGSSGFGRDYRQRLNGEWGIVDTEDCIAAARHLAEQGQADGDRMLIHGGSAGGYTTLCALVFHDAFSAGASYYGVADAETLAQDTHKFESRYLDRLIGPYPERADLYRERSPIHFVERLNVPVILFQGLEDEVVPPSQAEQMVEALKKNGVPYEYLAFEGEQHGFRKAETVESCLRAELDFYGRVFGFQPEQA
jgi:dipeptidyl aminopeptidase/acylaminoacyl peptidase